MMNHQRLCATRALKNARYLQKHLPGVIPALEPEAGFGSIVPFSVLSRLHRLKESSLPGDLRAALSGLVTPAVQAVPQTPLFNGTVYVAGISFAVDTSEAPGKKLSVAAADLAIAIDFLTLASKPISAYASAYGKNGLSVAPATLAYSVKLSGSSFNDRTLQGWVNEIAKEHALDTSAACVVVLNPQGVTNTDAQSSQGVLGYHGIANLPYCFVNVFGQSFTVQDAADVYAWQLSHEVAEMTVDPSANGANPEVCDPCGPNCPPDWRSFFDAKGYVGTSSTFPPGFAYEFFINAIVQPGYASECPAPQTACVYSPP
ncbi:MAG: hypothetical protein WA814_13870 [Candidatus Baltobacteraceae bacterium]